MNTSIITPEIAAFAGAVRDALHDLPAEEREELTDGLEADLAEAYAEDLKRELPDPVEYATELRDAAGLPKGEQAKVHMAASLAGAVRAMRGDLADAISRNPALVPVRDFFVAIRPLWWVTRAGVAVWVLTGFLGPWTLWLLFGFAIVSVQWGRGRWTFPGLAPMVVIGNIVAALLLLPALAQVNIIGGTDAYVDDGIAVPDQSLGLVSGGETVTNIFAYGADGEPLENVQLFDQGGRPLVVQRDPMRDECFDQECSTTADGMAATQVALETGALVGNVFPLSMIQTRYNPDTDAAEIDPGATPQAPEAPFLKVPKVAPSNQ